MSETQEKRAAFLQPNEEVVSNEHAFSQSVNHPAGIAGDDVARLPSQQRTPPWPSNSMGWEDLEGRQPSVINQDQASQSHMNFVDSVKAFPNAGRGTYASHGAQHGFSETNGDKITFGTTENGKMYVYETSTKEDKIGEGIDGAYRCTDLSNGKQYALKMYKITDRHPQQQLLRNLQPRATGQEIAIQNDLCAYKMVKHDNIVNYEKVIESESMIFVLMELIVGCDLFDAIIRRGRQGFAEQEARYLFEQLTKALCYLHSKGVIHSDIKAENAMVIGDIGSKDCRLKLIDFGYSCFPEYQDFHQQFVVRDVYMPPEFFNNATLRPSVSTDMWRLGCLLFVMLMGRAPYDRDQCTFYGAARRAAMKFSKGGHYNSLSDDARSLIEALLQGDPVKRPDAKQVLAHPWVLA